MREDGFAFVSLFRLILQANINWKEVYQGNTILGLVIPSQERDLNRCVEIVAEIIGILPDILNVKNNLWTKKKKKRSKKVLIFPQEKNSTWWQKVPVEGYMCYHCETWSYNTGSEIGWRLMAGNTSATTVRCSVRNLYPPACLINIDTLSPINMTVPD